MSNSDRLTTPWTCAVALILGAASWTVGAAEDHSQHAASKTETATMPAMPGMAAMQQAKDRAEIEDVMWRYARALDTLDADGYVAVYTEDGQFGTGERATKGRAALHKMIADLQKSRDERKAKGEAVTGTLHMEANHSVSFQDRDHATYNAYWMTVFPSADAKTPPRLAAVGRSVDQLARVNGKWLIQLRDVAPKD